MQALAAATRPFLRFFTESHYASKAGQPGVNDFAIGNPHELALPGLVDALQRWAVPQDEHWYAYKNSERRSQEIIAESLATWRGIPFEPADIALTNAGFGALAVGLKVLTDRGDEVIFSLPPWFFYEVLCVEAGLTPVKVNTLPETFDLDVDAIAAAITPRTRVVIVNTPNNPTGRIYPPETLQRLAAVLDAASAENGRRIYILSDEPYSRIVFDGRAFHSPTAFYPHTLLAYSYGKVLLAPGQRLGFLAMPPTLPERERLRQDILLTQVAGGPGPLVHRHQRPAAQARPHGGRTARPGLRGPLARGHLLPAAQVPLGRRRRLFGPAGGARHTGPARLGHRAPRLLPHLADRYG
jgi:aspartate aminotransferase